MKARRSAKVAFIASVLAATPVATTLSAQAGALTGTCSTGTDNTTRTITLEGSGDLNGLIKGSATDILGTTNLGVVADGIATTGDDDVVVAPVDEFEFEGTFAGFASTLAGNASSWAQSWSGTGSETDISLNTCGTSSSGVWLISTAQLLQPMPFRLVMARQQ